MTPRALVLTGRGRYEDPWHDHAATSHVVARTLGTMDIEAEVRSLFPDSMGDLADYDLVVVNAGHGRVDPDFDGDHAAWVPAHRAMMSFIDAGGAVLGLHQAAGTFADNTRWGAALGGRWVWGHSMHPPQELATFSPTGDHPIAVGLDPVVVDDEQYCHLVLEPGSQVFLTTRHEGTDHPVAWVSATGRVVYDSLGHDVGSYASPSRLALLRREVDWLLRR